MSNESEIIHKLTDELSLYKELYQDMNQLLTDSKIGVWRVDVDNLINFRQIDLNLILHRSISLATAFGFDENNIPNTIGHWFSLLHPDDINAVIKDFQKPIDDLSSNNTHTAKYRLLIPNGEYHWFRANIHVKRNPDNSIFQLYGTYQDAHSDVINELTVKQMQPYLLLSDSFKVTKINASFRKLTNFTKDNFLNKDFKNTNLFYQHNKTWQQIKKQLLIDKKWYGEISIIDKNDNIIPVILSITSICNSSNNISYYILNITDITEQKQLQHKLSKQSKTDALTGCYNRHVFNQELETLPNNSCLLIADIDNFKIVNDTYGHQQGDRALVFVAQQIKRCIKGRDILSRIGGEEFGIVLYNTSLAQARKLAEEIRVQVFTNHLLITRNPAVKINISISIGVATNLITASAKTLFEHADNAMYWAKAAGKNQVKVYKPSLDKTINR